LLRRIFTKPKHMIHLIPYRLTRCSFAQSPLIHLTRASASVLLLFTGLGVSGLSASPEQAEPTFSQIVVFGDSLSDTGNVRNRTGARTNGLVDYPSHTFNYSNGRFTNDDANDPSSSTFVGVWHEQLARTFLTLPAASNSLDGGSNYAFGGATTNNGTHDEVVVTVPVFGDVTITIDDMGKQMDDYLAAHAIDPNALYVVWGGGNDLFNDDSAANVTATAARATAVMSRLITAGAQHIMVPNVPPLGDIPRYASDGATIVSKNTASLNYRNELNADITTALSAFALQGVTPTVYRLDVWTNTIRVMTYPERYGLTDVRHSSKGNSNVNPDNFLFWDDKHPTTAGHYWTAKGANDALTIPFTPSAKAINLSTRLFVDVGERVSIAGFIVTGTISERVLIRGIGPSLTASGVPNALADPTLTLFDESGTMLMTNDNWQDTQAAEITATGSAPQNALESAIVATLAPGRYTAVLAGTNGTTGNGLAEIYDLDPSTSSALGNLSTRGFVGSGDNAMIGGIIVGSGDLPIVVLRALGPALTGVGIVDPLLDPTIELHDGNGAVIGFNDNWKDGQTQSLFATLLSPNNDSEAAIVAFLAPGNYTVVVRGKGDTTGVALVEAYRVP
jgi:phospholipase/lecithinase/hemolysin